MERKITDLNKRLVYLAICAYANNEIANFSLDNLSKVGISKDSLSRIIKELHKEGELEDLTVPGFFKRIKLVVEKCPNFIYSSNLTVGHKELLVDCYDKLSEYNVRTAAQLTKDLGYEEEYAKTSRTMSNIKKYSAKDIFTILQSVEEIHLEPTHDKFPLVKCEQGYQIDSYPDAIKTRELSGQEAERIKRELRKSRDTIGAFLFKKIKNSAHRRTGKLEIDITPEYLEELYLLQDKRDFYSHIKFMDVEEISIDRINNNFGYIKGNIVLTTTEINMFRKSLSVERFIELCVQIANNAPNIKLK